MHNRATARLALMVGGIAAAVSWWAFAANLTVLNPAATRDAAQEVFASEPIQRQAIDSLTKQLTAALPANLVAQSTTQINAAAASALRDPRVATAFATQLANLHEQLLTIDGTTSQLVVDSSALSESLQRSLAPTSPELAAQLAGRDLSLRFDTSSLPNISGPKRYASTVAWWAALVAIAAWAAALFLHPNFALALRGVGRRLIGIGTVPIVVWVLLPALLNAVQASAAQTFSPIASAYGRRLAPPATIVLCVGIGVWAAGRFGPKSKRHHDAGIDTPHPHARPRPRTNVWRDAARVRTNGRFARAASRAQARAAATARGSARTHGARRGAAAPATGVDVRL